MTPRCAYSRHCGEEPIGKGPDGRDYCFDHFGEMLIEAEREALEIDAHGRNRRVMRHGRAW
jgi:hypothetical protein